MRLGAAVLALAVLIGAAPSSPRPAPPAPIRFSDVTRRAGIDFVHDNGHAGRYRFPELVGSGLALFDYDGDGALDIFLVNGNRLGAPPDRSVRSALYRNRGDGRFEDVSERAGVGVVGYGHGACTGDADGDGHVDLYVTALGSGRFFRNRGDGTFAAAETQAGLESDGWGQSCAFLDYDGDGRLDLYLVNYLGGYTLEMPQTRQILLGGRKQEDYGGPRMFQGTASRLLRNRGDGRFEDVTRAAGLLRGDGKGMGLACVDFDGDDRTDVFQANDGVPNFLFRNLGGRFEEVGLVRGVAVGEDGSAKGSMGVDVGDIDNDGDLDLAIPVVRSQVMTLYRNDAGSFSDVAVASGVAQATRRVTGFSPNFGDFDNDGDLDLFLANGEVHSHESAPADASYHARYGVPDQVLANDGAGRFTDVSAQAGPHFTQKLIGRGSAAGDLDNDGDLDLVISNQAGPAVVLRNDSARGHWLTLALRGRGGNREAIGAKVWLDAGGRRQYRELHGGGGYESVGDRRLHFGLGAASRVERLEIRWPDGLREVSTSLAADRILRIERPAAQ